MRDRFISNRRRFLGQSALAIAGARLGAIGGALEQLGCAASSVPVTTSLSSLAKANEWINSPPLTPQSLKGKVVLIDFCTYTCINWLRTLPYIRAWAEKYKGDGLVMIGVQTPEFEFEANLDNVRQATKAMNVPYPIAVDNDYAIWNAFDNHYWPALYFIDHAGRIRHHQFGEGDYDSSENTLRRLLADNGARNLGDKVGDVDGRGVEAAADWGNLKSPESYLGYARAEYFASPQEPVNDARRAYDFPSKLNLNQWALLGDWTIRKQGAVLNSPTGRIRLRFHSRDVHLVMGPSMRGNEIAFRVTVDGQAPFAAHGVDVDERGNGVANEQRIYQLIRQRGPIDDKIFEIEFLAPGVEAAVFTFG